MQTVIKSSHLKKKIPNILKNYSSPLLHPKLCSRIWLIYICMPLANSLLSFLSPNIFSLSLSAFSLAKCPPIFFYTSSQYHHCYQSDRIDHHLLPALLLQLFISPLLSLGTTVSLFPTQQSDLLKICDYVTVLYKPSNGFLMSLRIKDKDLI